jgi:hypothetical protein
MEINFIVLICKRSESGTSQRAWDPNVRWPESGKSQRAWDPNIRWPESGTSQRAWDPNIRWPESGTSQRVKIVLVTLASGLEIF